MAQDTALITPGNVRLTTWIEQGGVEVDEVTIGGGTVLHVIHVRNSTMIPRDFKIKGTLPDGPVHCEFIHPIGLDKWEEDLNNVLGMRFRHGKCEIRLKGTTGAEAPVQCPELQWLDLWPAGGTLDTWTGPALEVPLKIA